MDKRLFQNLNNQQQDYIAPFLWLHGEDDSLIINEIHRIYDSGIRSICLESRTHEDFCKQEWWDDIRLILEECRQLGMKVWILDDKHYPSGYANGIFEEKYKDLRPFGITEFHIDIAGPCTDACAMSDYSFSTEGDEIIGVIACKHIPNSDRYTGEIINITNGLCDDLVYFSLPEGLWRIFFLVKTRYGISPSQVDFCDVLNPQTIELFIEEVYEPHYSHFSDFFGNTFLGFFSDEPGFRNNTRFSTTTPLGVEYAHYPWHKRVFEKLYEIYGEKTISYFPSLWYNIDDVSAQFRLDYMNIITDEHRNNFCNKIADWCHEHGIMYIGHIIEDNNAHYKTGSTGGHYFKALDKQDMSGIDVVFQQIVPGLTECSNRVFASYKHTQNKFYNYELAKLASSFAHIDKRKNGRAMCEIFGAYGWAEGTKIMKYLADHMLVRGINYFVPHAFSPKLNDTDCPPNFYDGGKNPQFKYFKNIMEYMQRMCHLFSDGVHIPTCAILYDAEMAWMSDDEHLPIEDIGKVLYDNMFDYDIIPISYLDKIDKDGYINGEKYPLLIVPYAKKYPDGLMEKLSNLPIPVIFVTNTIRNTDFENVALDNLVEYMFKNNFTDILCDYNGKFLRYYHYKRNDIHFYMISNEDIAHDVNAVLQLKEFSGGSYIIYDAFENKAVRYDSKNDDIKVNVKPYNALVIIVGDNTTVCAKETHTDIISSSIITPIFDISIKKEQDDSFVHYATTDKLFNITGKGYLPRFSGNIKYDTTITINETGRYTLDIGNVGETAEVFVNNKKIGTRIFPPYTFDISDFVTSGENELSIICSNTSAYTYRDIFSKFLMFDASGLLGPITLTRYNE